MTKISGVLVSASIHSINSPQDFKSEEVLARWLGAGLLTQMKKRGEGLRDAFESLATEARSNLLNSWGKKNLENLFQLADIRDQQLFFSRLLSLGRDLEQQGKGDLAALVYNCVASEAKAYPELKTQAEKDLNLLQGIGSFGDKALKVAGTLLKDMVSPQMMALGVLGMAARLGTSSLLAMRVLEKARWARGMTAMLIEHVGAFAIHLPLSVAFGLTLAP